MSPKKIRLYHFPASRSARVRWVLYETVGEEVEIERVDLYSGAQHHPDFLAKNPNHNVPALEITWETGETTVMLESAAMVVFFADAFPEKNLAPPADGLSPARADYLQMLHFGGSWMDMMLWQVRVHEHVLPAGEADANTIERYRSKMAKEVEPQLLARLTKHDFICGGDFTAADCVIGHNVTWARGYGMCQDRAFRAYLARLAKRSAFRKAFDDVKEFSIAPPDGPARAGTFSG
ncbi:MAG: glutathione S-transferase family protein [Pseudomonadota bacterium]